jgi:hypothetical protein
MGFRYAAASGRLAGLPGGRILPNLCSDEEEVLVCLLDVVSLLDSNAHTVADHEGRKLVTIHKHDAVRDALGNLACRPGEAACSHEQALRGLEDAEAAGKRMNRTRPNGPAVTVALGLDENPIEPKRVLAYDHIHAFIASGPTTSAVPGSPP